MDDAIGPDGVRPSKSNATAHGESAPTASGSREMGRRLMRLTILLLYAAAGWGVVLLLWYGLSNLF